MADDVIIKIRLDGAKQETANLEKLQTGIKKLAAEKKRLDANEKELTKAINATGVATKEQNAALKKINQQQVANSTALKLNKTAYRENEAQVIRNTKAQQGNVGSLRQMQAQLAKDQFAYDRLSKSQRNNINVGGKLQKSIDKQSRALKGLEKSTGRTQRNVGNYGEAMNDVLPIMGGFGGQIMAVQRSLGAIKSAIAKTTVAQAGMTASTKASTAATKQMSITQKLAAFSTNLMTKGLKLFKIALAATGIGLIVVALGSLVAALASTQKGMDAMNRVLEPIKEVFATLFGIIQDVGLKVFDALKKAISSPKESLISLGKAIKQNLINRFTGAVELVKAQAKLLVSTFKVLGLGLKKALAGVPLLGAGIDQEAVAKDLEQAKNEAIKNAKEVAHALIQTTTGLNKEQQLAAIKLTKDLSAEGKKRIEDAIKRGREIADLEIEIDRASIGLRKETEAAKRAFEAQKEIAQNLLKTDKERLEAVKQAKIELSSVTEIEQAQLKRQIKLATLRTKANDTDNEAKKELSDLQADFIAVEAAEIKKRILLGNLGNTIIKKRIALNKKAAENVAKDLAKLDAAKAKSEQNEIKRNEDKESEILENKAKSLQLEAQLDELAIEEKLKDEKGLEMVTAEDIAEAKFNIAINLERKLANLRLKQNRLQSSVLLKNEEELQTKIFELKKASGGKETIEIIKAQDELSATKREKEKIDGEELTLIKLENKVNEEEKLGEEDTRQKEIKDEKQAISDQEELERVKTKEDEIRAIKNTAIQAGEEVKKLIFDNQKRRIEENSRREIEALNLKRQTGEINEEEFEKKRKEIDKKAFEDGKKLALKENIIDFAVAAGETIAKLGWPLALPAIASLGLKAISTAATIKSQKFSKGGVLHGASHAQGGVNLGNNQEGEGGEAIINKRSTAKHLPLLSAINQDGGGVSLGGTASPSTGALSKFGNGGIINNVTNQGGGLDIDEIRQAFADSMSTIKVQNVASETTEVANRVETIQDSATF